MHIVEKASEPSTMSISWTDNSTPHSLSFFRSIAMAGIHRITILIALQITALVLASYLGYARTFTMGTEHTKFSSFLQEWKARLMAALDSSTSVPSKEQQLQQEGKTGQSLKDMSHLQHSFEEDILQVPCGYIIALGKHQHSPPINSVNDDAVVVPLKTFLDPLQNLSTISIRVVMKDRFLQLLYEEAGDRKVIPKGSLYLRMGSHAATLPSPELVVVEEDDKEMGNDSCQLRLGRNFLRGSQGRIDLDEMEMYVTVGDQKNVLIPFIQPRRSLSGMDHQGEGEL